MLALKVLRNPNMLEHDHMPRVLSSGSIFFFLKASSGSIIDSSKATRKFTTNSPAGPYEIVFLYMELGLLDLKNQIIVVLASLIQKQALLP